MMVKLNKIIKRTLISSFYKETQLGRSLKGIGNKYILKFKKELIKEIDSLLEKADRVILQNDDIRDSIKKLSKLPKISVGQAQKVINVYLKVYCILLNRDKTIPELDCPLDSYIMGMKDKPKHLKKYSLKNLNDFDEYIK